MPLSMHDKEVIAVSIAVAAGCRPCTLHHMAEARGAGATESVLQAAVAGAICVRTAATEGMRRHALGLEPAADKCGCAATDLLSELASVGASLAVNCTVSLDKHLAAARRLGAGEEHLQEVLVLAGKIRSVAVGHAERQLGGATPEGRCAAMAANCC